MEQPNINKIMFMLGEMSSDIKSIKLSQEELKGTMSSQSGRIAVLETAETTRIARAGIFGVFGGILATAAWQIIKSKLFNFSS